MDARATSNEMSGSTIYFFPMNFWLSIFGNFEINVYFSGFFYVWIGEVYRLAGGEE